MASVSLSTSATRRLHQPPQHPISVVRDHAGRYTSRRRIVCARSETGSGSLSGGDSSATVGQSLNLATKQAQLLEQNKKLLQMQRELLEQIEERKRLHAALVDSVSLSLQPPESPQGSNQNAAILTPAQSQSPPKLPKFPAPNSRPLPVSTPKAAPPASPAASLPVRNPPPPRATPVVPSKLKPQAPPSAPASPADGRPLFNSVVRPKPAPPRPLPVKPALASTPTAAPASVPIRESKTEEKTVVAAKSEAVGDAPPAEEKPEPLAGPNVMNVVVVASECAPWSKTGGLGDVVGALPKALARRGHRVMVVAPRYKNYEEPWETGVRKWYSVNGSDVEVGYFHTYVDGVDYVFVDSPCYHHVAANIYGGSREEVLFRMILLCKAAVEAPWHVPCGGVAYGDSNLVFIANDWHTSLLPVYLQAYYRDIGLMQYTRSILVIHNMAHQGRGPLADFGKLGLPDHYVDKFRLFDPMGGEHMNIFMAGLITAHRIVAVSHGYAWECQTAEGGWGLDGVVRDQAWKLRGVVNGIDEDEWSPEKDTFLTAADGYVNYSIADLEEGKAQCKAALQKELGLPVRPDVPLVGFIGRLDYQKGVDIIGDALPWMMSQDLQLVLLGSGRSDLEDLLRSFEGNHRDKCRSWVGFSVKMAHRITAGVDVLLMPSRFEPCGLNQLYAMRYGTIPVVHSVGGLRDTVPPFDPFQNTGLGWTFDRAEASGLVHAMGNCLWTYKDYKETWLALQKKCMSQDLSWDNAAQQYEEVLLAAKFTW